MKVAINNCYGGFSLSDAAAEECIKRGMTVRNIFEEGADETDFSYHPPKSEAPPEKQKDYWDSFGTRYYARREGMDFRTNPIVIAVIEEMGEMANGECAEIKIVDVPDELTPDDIEVCEYDGMEWVAEKHRTWS